MRRKVMLALAAAVLATSVSAPAEAQFGPQPPNQLWHQSTTVGRINPLGFISLYQLVYRRRLYQTDSIFFRDNYAGIGFIGAASPAFGRGGLQVQVQPVPFFRFWASYELVGYFGTFDVLQSAPSYTRAWSDSDLDRGANMGGDYGALGTQLTLSGTLQAKVGPGAVRSVLRATRGDYDLRDGDQVYYDIVFDMLVADEGWLLTNDFDALYLHADRWTAGIRWTWTRSFFPERTYRDVRATQPTLVTNRVGPLLAYTFFKEYKARFNGPTVLLLLNWWVRHPHRTGEDVHQAVPFVMLGFSFQGDLLGVPSGS